MLLIDAANVVGSRPNGWWRDRAGASRSLVDRVRAAVAAGRLAEPVVVVLEGDARGGAEEVSQAVSPSFMHRAAATIRSLRSRPTPVAK
jgi:hypothetical protein